MLRLHNFIDGEEVSPISGCYFPTEDPALGAPYAEVPDSDEQDLEAAMQAARRAFPAWRDTLPQDRAVLLDRIADLIEQQLEDFARAESVDTGKPIWLCRTMDIPRSIANLRAFADAARNFSGDIFAKSSTYSYTLRQPIGVVTTISPWNLPLLLFTWKLAPALAAGNCVIAKPSEVTPMTASIFARVTAAAGLPPGVFNLLHGRGANIGAALTRHPQISAISFTGGTTTGIEIYSAAARQLKKVSLELGGKNPTLILDDADFESALDGTVRAAFTNQGQICLCGSRILIHKPLYEKFKAALIARTNEIRIGDPLTDDTRFAAIVSRPHMEKILSYIQLARQEGGTILTGGHRVSPEGRCHGGYFIQPTLIEGLPAGCRTNQEEIFGPVATLLPFTDEAEALIIANSTPYGLAASVWTRDQARAQRIAAQLDSGTVWINCWNLRDLDMPFGGMKKSGIGREGKRRAMEFFTEEKSITAPYST
jgi:aminomuconate-semialdehyde/2-hydroxymuconate-6-semialdehyde dehydrogenase